MMWLQILHFLGLTNLSDEEILKYNMRDHLRVTMHKLNKIEDERDRAIRFHDFALTLPNYLRDPFVDSVSGLSFQLRAYVLGALQSGERQETLTDAPRKTAESISYDDDETDDETNDVAAEIEERVETQSARVRRDYLLREQIQAIQAELGDTDIPALETRIRETKLSTQAREVIELEFKRLQLMGQDSAEATVLRRYIDLVLDLPWNNYSKTTDDLSKAERLLEFEHYGLVAVKDTILDFLAGQIHSGSVHGRALCIVGPPGVGKSSLARSIAQATDRKIVRISLGGVRDEAEIRGHRRTYIGALPGKIMHAMRQAGYSNPLILLDEIDKLGRDYRGDPASALLDILDPEQNKSFVDHFIEIPFDLSSVLFIATANSTKNIPEALLDRMEVITIPGYTEDEKLHIARMHLLARQSEAHGLTAHEWTVSDDALLRIIRFYTREPGVRNLSRQIAILARKAVRGISLGRPIPVEIGTANLQEFLGLERYRYGEAESEDLVGVAAGLAWTEIGGDLLSVEAVTMPGKGRLTATGKMGDVMRESVAAASTYARKSAAQLGVDPDFFSRSDIHVHIPEGAIAKDGPAGGLALITAIASAITGRPVRKDVAMTGEITLRGRVLKVDGLREKLIAANRAGIANVIIPVPNIEEVNQLDDELKHGINIIAVTTVDEVLDYALIGVNTIAQSSAATANITFGPFR